MGRVSGAPDWPTGAQDPGEAMTGIPAGDAGAEQPEREWLRRTWIFDCEDIRDADGNLLTR
jgi:hypothetical protein